MELSAAASASATGTPPVCSPMTRTSSMPWLASMISWAMRHTARCTSSRSITRVRGAKTPPYGGAWRRSRSAISALLSVRASLDPLHGQAPTLPAQPEAVTGPFTGAQGSGVADPDLGAVVERARRVVARPFGHAGGSDVVGMDPGEQPTNREVGEHPVREGPHGVGGQTRPPGL